MEKNSFSNKYMSISLELAKEAADKGDIPVGAVIVDPSTDTIITKSHNRANIDRDPTLHAEIICIKEACEIKGSKLLQGYDIYITLEPCAMCAAAISYARLSRIYFGAFDSKFGAIENGVRLFESDSAIFVPEIYGGIMEKENVELLQSFFSTKRH
jgi:tRNA(adenine34) deaminase